MIRRAVRLAAMVVGGLALAGCAEQTVGGSACPVLCPQENLAVVEEVLTDAVVLDTTIAGYPELGVDSRLLLANRGDTLETRAVIRFDELPRKFTMPNSLDSLPIDSVKGAALLTKVLSEPINKSQPVRIDVYDVDTTAADTLTAALLPLFRADRRIGGVDAASVSIPDSILSIPLSDSAVLAKITTGTRLRVGIAVRAAGSVQFHIGSVGSTDPPKLTFRVRGDTAVACCVKSPIAPSSKTPAGQPFQSVLLPDFTVVVRDATPVLPAGTLAVGGVLGRRSYLRFKVPSRILDSTSIVRATLLLMQKPNLATADAADTVAIQVTVPAGRDPFTDLSRQLALVLPLHRAEGFPSPTSRDLFSVRPEQGTLRQLELVELVNRWRTILTDSSARGIVLRASGEREEPGEVHFHSREAADPALRPRLRITYVPRGGYGVP